MCWQESCCVLRRPSHSLNCKRRWVLYFEWWGKEGTYLARNVSVQQIRTNLAFLLITSCCVTMLLASFKFPFYMRSRNPSAWEWSAGLFTNVRQGEQARGSLCLDTLGPISPYNPGSRHPNKHKLSFIPPHTHAHSNPLFFPPSKI